MQLLLARQHRGPVVEAPYRIPLGQADVKREGSDITITTWGGMVPTALQAAAELAKADVSTEVIDLRTLVPLDLATIERSVRKTRRLLIAHRATGFGGFGGEIAALIGERCFGLLAAPVKRVAGAFTPVPRAESLEAARMPQPATITAAAMEMMK
jgi:2-oxoisovalerate dehydrogenase E1 component